MTMRRRRKRLAVSVQGCKLFDCHISNASSVHPASAVYNWLEAAPSMAPSTSKIATARLQLLQRVMEGSSKKLHIRQYDPADLEAVMHICRVTAHPSAGHEPAISIVPLIFALPYVLLYPEYTFVLDSGSGDCVGYCLAVPCTATYLQRYKSEYLPTLDRTRYPSPPPIPGLVAGNEIERWPDLLEDYPAHLHIDILPDFQAMGGGRRLMAELMKKLNADRVRGIHLMKPGENKGAEIFYGHVGFERYPVVMDGGESGEIGRKAGGCVCMVQKSS
ncbi:hypothetical protein V502_01666 [Pseudogymnoascus sp. VKM F-4520 (FW-2644)]|nr:hypothetical protein V502_01666 [Pseudogymnoascus sp. VKM F-4520 (FW-2644)]